MPPWSLCCITICSSTVGGAGEVAAVLVMGDRYRRYDPVWQWGCIGGSPGGVAGNEEHEQYEV